MTYLTDSSLVMGDLCSSVSIIEDHFNWGIKDVVAGGADRRSMMKLHPFLLRTYFKTYWRKNVYVTTVTL